MSQMKPLYWLPIGIAIGTAFGVALGNLGLGIGVGVAIGAALSVTLAKKPSKKGQIFIFLAHLFTTLLTPAAYTVRNHNQGAVDVRRRVSLLSQGRTSKTYIYGKFAGHHSVHGVWFLVPD